MTSKLLIGTAVITLVACAPGLSVREVFAGQGQSSSRSVSTSINGETSIAVSVFDDGERLTINGRGDIALAPDGSGLDRLGDGSFLDVRLDAGGTERRVRWDGRNGAIDRRFWVDGAGQAWSAEADRFVAEVMPMVFRETGLNTPERVAWLLDEVGEDGALDEIALVRSDSIQRRYTEAWAEQASISAPAFDRLMQLANTNIGSDSELRRTLESVYAARQPAGDALTTLIQAADSIGSDSEARRLLETVVPALDADEAVSAFLEVARDIGSDSEMRRALESILGRPDLADTQVEQLLQMAGRDIGSDSELRRVLETVAGRVTTDETARAYTRAVGAVGSDSEARRALEALADAGTLSLAGWRLLLEAARGIGSDSECARLLEAVADRIPRDEQTLAAYRDTLETIGSGGEYRRASRALFPPS